MKILSILFLLLSGYTCLAQAPSYDDLTILYADGKYEKLIDKAMKYTEKESTKKDPNPHIFMAKGLYKLSIAGDANELYKNAFKEALGAFAKAQKLDNDEYKAMQVHAKFVEEFTTNAAERMINDMESGDYKKAYGWNVKYLKIAQDMGGSKFVEAACKFRNADKSGANGSWKEAESFMSDVKSLDEWWTADIMLLKVGIIESAKCFLEVKQFEKAKDLLDKYRPLFEGDEDFETAYNELLK